ncbi:hypothetical protein LSTR_LSTR002875 [Laodelphax striatellus]|uniref:RING-type domain-containing protein n=1 Tax=Laodelphax striatellus TaxID=195883 RepID=A0A482XUZ9_LAOST|nr:hypothetical protein LSTR_LSTR002875 [Laodelphax striatellus]
MAEEDQEDFVFEGKLEASTIYEWVKDYHTANPPPDENVQHPALKPKLRSYQERAVRWMLCMEKADNRTVRIENDGGKLVRFGKGGILADEMGLGKTVEVLACLLANPNAEFKKQLEEYIDKMKDDLLKYEAENIKNVNEHGDENTEIRREEESSRLKRKGDNTEVAGDKVNNRCKSKRKSVYSVATICTLFEREARNEDRLCEDSVRLGDENTESKTVESFSTAEFSRNGVEDDGGKIDGDNCVDVSGEGNLVRADVNEGEVKIRGDGESEDNKELVGGNVIESEKRTEREGEVGEKDDNELVGEEIRRRTDEVDNKELVGVDKSEKDNGGFAINGLETSDKVVVGSCNEVTGGRKRFRKSVTPKRKRKKKKESDCEDDDDDEDFHFQQSAGARRSSEIRRQKSKIFEDDDSDFVCKSAGDSAPYSRAKSTRTKRRLVCEDVSFDDEEDEDDPVQVASEPRRRQPKSDAKNRRPKSDDPDFAPAPPKKRAKSAKSSLLRSELQKMYEAMLSETSPAVKGAERRAKIAKLKMESDYRCCCLDPSLLENSPAVKCPLCGKLQHKACVGFAVDAPYVCFTCWPQRALVPSSATLIVTPSSISSQWSDEIKKHLADASLSVLEYGGVRAQEGYHQPLQLAQYDIVITTYQVLLKELDYVNEDPDSRPRAMRYARKFFPPSSPLTCVKWWRICLDEAQMVESVTSKIYSMVSVLPTINRWAVCGTPIQRQAADLFGLVSFLQVHPYGTCRRQWNWLEASRRALAEFLPQVMWRTSKCHVLTELNVPPQTTVAHWLTFAPVETFFYRKQHALCAALFKQKAQQLLANQPLSTPLRQVPAKHLTALLLPLLRLRQACLHPQLVRGQFVAIRHTMTMPQLLDQMVAKAALDAEEALRRLVASLNGVAGVRLLTGESIEAVNAYRRVLHLAQEYEGRLKMDTLQKIHTMYNLATVLESSAVTVAPTLRDATLLDDVKALETDYLHKRLGDVAGNKCVLQELADKYGDKLPGKVLRRCDWWSDMLQQVDTQQLVHKIQVEFEGAKGPLMTLLRKMSGIVALMQELVDWQAAIDKTRESVIEQIRQLEEIPTTVMAGHAVTCHLRNQKPANVKSRCLICRTEHELKQYESLLFWIMNKDESKSKSKKAEEEEQKQAQPSGEDANQPSTVANLENNTIFEVYNVGTWKPSQHEQIIRLIYSSCSKRLMKRDWAEEAQNQFGALDILRKEFRRLRLLWSQIADQVAASDELAMAKLRLRLATTDEYLANEGATGSSRRKRKPAPKINENENRNVISPLLVDTLGDQLRAETAVNESALRKSAGTLYYLQNLQKNGDKQTEPCPVCHIQLTDSWSVLKCGHCYCYDCIHTLTHNFNRETITCPVCREMTLTADVSHIEARHAADSHIKAQVKGSFTTKIEAMVAELLAIRAKEPDVKVLMFSAWDGVLDVLAEALELNEVQYCRLSSGHAQKQRDLLMRFRTERGLCALLMPLRTGAKGLNLVEATHVFLAEPILNPADQLQAVGRVHRIGQTRETFVHKFAVKGTIEEKMLTAMEGSDTKWSKDKVTVQQLLDLFTPVETNKQ